MKVCLNCKKSFDRENWECPFCQVLPIFKEGLPIFAPEAALNNESFKAEYFEELTKLELENFWFHARKRLINWAIQKYFTDATTFLEIGCGTGDVLAELGKSIPLLKLFGSDIFCEALSYASKRTPKATYLQMDGRSIPFEDEFDIIGAFDVLEHIQEDHIVLLEMFKALRHGGGLVLTVPQHKILWSDADVFACHRRRYKARELREKVIRAGFQIMRQTSFVFLLLPLMIVSRLRQRILAVEYDLFKELKLSATVNALLEKCLVFDQGMIRAGFDLPIGGSLLLIAQKL